MRNFLNMSRPWSIPMRIVVLIMGLVVVLMIAGPLLSLIFGSSGVEWRPTRVGWTGTALSLIFLWTIVWWFADYRKSTRRVMRSLFNMMIAVAALMSVTDIAPELYPQLVVPLYHPIGTVLGFLLAGLVSLAFALEGRLRDREADR